MRKNLKKILSLVIVMALMLSTFTGVFQISASAAGITTTNSDAFASLEENYLLYSNLVTSMCNISVPNMNDSTTPFTKDIYTTEAKAANLTDNTNAAGEVCSDYYFMDGSNYIPDYYLDIRNNEAMKENTTYYYQMTYDLGGTLNPSEFMLANYMAGNTYVYRYALFGSIELENLYNEENCFGTIVNAEAAYQQNTVITDASEIKYFGIRIYSYLGMDWGTGADFTCRLEEWQLNGTDYVKDVFTKVTEYSDINSDTFTANGWDKDNVLNDAVKTTFKTVTKEENYDYLANAFDGVLDTEVGGWPSGLEGDDNNHGLANGTDGKTNYFELVYKFEGTLNATEFFIVSNPIQDYRTHRYEISFANNEAELFTENQVAGKYYKNTNKTRAQSFTIDNVKARYFGIRIYQTAADHTSTANCGWRVNEMGVKGNIIPDPITFDKTVSGSNKYIPEGANLLASADKKWIISYKNSETGETVKKESTAFVSEMVDGNVGSLTLSGEAFLGSPEVFPDATLGNTNGGKEYYYSFIANMNINIYLDKFYMLVHDDDYFSVKRYDISFASSEADLFTDNAANYEYVLDGSPASQHEYTISDLKAQYFGIRVYEMNASYHFCAAELGVTGTNKGLGYGYVTNANTSAVPTGTNLLAAADEKITFIANGVEQQYDYSNADIGERDVTMTDGISGDPQRYFTIYGNYAYSNLGNNDGEKKNFYQFLYTLDKEYTIDEFAFINSSYNWAGFCVGRYDMFASDSLETLFDEPIITYETDVFTAGQQFKIENSGVYRYIAIRVYQPNMTDDVQGGRFDPAEIMVTGSEVVYKDDSFKYFNSDKTQITEYIGEGGAVVIPATVTAIDADVFVGKGITKLTVSNDTLDISAVFADADLAILTIVANPASLARTFAHSNNVWFEYIDVEDAVENDYTDDAEVDILDLVRLKKYHADNDVRLLKQASAAYDLVTDPAATLTYLRQDLLGAFEASEIILVDDDSLSGELVEPVQITETTEDPFGDILNSTAN